MEKYVKTETSQLTAENEEEYQELQSQLISAKTDLAAYQEKELDIVSIQEEITALYKEVKEVSAGYIKTPKTGVVEENQEECSENIVIILEVDTKITQSEMKKISDWLEKRLKAEQVLVYQNIDGVLYSEDYVDSTEETGNKKSVEAQQNEGMDSVNE